MFVSLCGHWNMSIINMYILVLLVKPFLYYVARNKLFTLKSDFTLLFELRKKENAITQGKAFIAHIRINVNVNKRCSRGKYNLYLWKLQAIMMIFIIRGNSNIHCCNLCISTLHQLLKDVYLNFFFLKRQQWWDLCLCIFVKQLEATCPHVVNQNWGRYSPEERLQNQQSKVAQQETEHTKEQRGARTRAQGKHF